MAQARINIPVSAAGYAAAIEGLSGLNQHLIRSGGFDYPSIYQSGIRYRREKKDTWRPITEVYKTGVGDCEDLAAARVAVLREQHGEKGARVGVYRTGPKRYHAIVVRADGSREDPSRALGMIKKRGFPMKLKQCKPIPGRPGAWVGVGADPSPDSQAITFDLYRSGKGFAGIVRIPTASPGAAIFAKTTTTPVSRGAMRSSGRLRRAGRREPPTVRRAKQATATKSIRLAARLVSNPAVRALLPPQAQMAVRALRSPLGKLAKKGAGKLLRKLF